MTWDYALDKPEILPGGIAGRIQDEPSAEKVLKEINGYAVGTRNQGSGVTGERPGMGGVGVSLPGLGVSPKVPTFLLKGFEELKDDGSTACGCWIYCGVWPEEERNRAAERVSDPRQHVNPNWAWAWPANRRMMYNRASADPDGKPWSERKRYVWWDPEQGKWTGYRRARFPSG